MPSYYIWKMTDTFITKIHVVQSRNIHDLEIKLSETERKHLIITGKNGSGKTSLLNDLNIFLQEIEKGKYTEFLSIIERIENKEEVEKKIESQLYNLEKEEEMKNLNVSPNYTKLDPTDPEFIRQQKHASQFNKRISEIHKRISELRDSINEKKQFRSFGGTRLFFSNADDLTSKYTHGDYLLAFFDAHRQAVLDKPTGISKVHLKSKYKINEQPGVAFIQYLVNLKAERSFARDDNEFDVVIRIDKWFDRFENTLREIFSSPNLHLKFDRNNYNFEIIEEGKLPYNLNTLSDGYSSILSIITELILRMENKRQQSYDLEGVVLIDEIETHLHVELQKKILPFLSNFFPKIQFIVTTHSPFVLSSISNAVICDLETGLVANDLSGYSYDALIESYFYSDKYSEELKRKISRYEYLTSLEPLSDEYKDELRYLKDYFDHVPKYLSKELMAKLQEIELNSLTKKTQ